MSEVGMEADRAPLLARIELLAGGPPTERLRQASIKHIRAVLAELEAPAEQAPWLPLTREELGASVP